MSELQIPKIGQYLRGVGTLTDIQDTQPTPPPTEKDYIFKEITAHCEVRLGKETLREFESVWDAYGLETSVEAAKEAAIKYCAKRKIGPESDLEVVVVKETEHRRRCMDTRGENFYEKGFYRFQHKEFGSGRDVPEDTKEIVWSSRKDILY